MRLSQIADVRDTFDVLRAQSRERFSGRVNRGRWQRHRAVMGLSWRERLLAKRPIDVGCLDFGVAQFMVMPAETFVGYQLAAQRMRPDSFVVVSGYGDGAPGYVPMAEHWREGYDDSYSWVTPESPAARSGKLAFERAGLTPDDVDVCQLYDAFTSMVLLTLEGLGFCKKGEGGPFVEDGKLRVGGALPTNTDGGGLSCCHPGMRGMFLMVEAVKQLRGEAEERQVPDAKVACVNGTGGWFSSAATLLLATD